MSDINLVIRYDNGNIDVVSKEAEKELGEAGKKGGKKFSTNLNKSFNPAAILGAIAKVGAAVAAIGAVTIFKSIQAASEQEDAVNRLAGSLRTAGDFSQEALTDLQDFASELQEVTKIGDETTLSMLSLAKGFGATNEQSKEIVSAAADMSVALGIDFNSAVRNVSKTLGGYAGELGEVIPELKEFTTEQLKSGAAIDLIAKQFQGLASNELNTFSGAFAQVQNSFGDFLEKIGSIITQSPLIIKGLNAVSKGFQILGSQVVAFGNNLNIFDDLITPILNFNDAVVKYVVAPLELVGNIGNVVFQGLVTGIARIVQGFGILGGQIGKLLSNFGIGEELSAGLEAFAASSKETADEAQASFEGAANNILDFELSTKLSEKNESLRTFFQEQRAIIDEESTASAEVINNKILDTANTGVQAAAGINLGFSTLSAGFAKAATDIAKVNKQIASSVKSGVVNSISNGIQKSVQAIANGENAFEAFGKAVLATFGDLAIQLGSFFIAQGIAIEAVQSVSGAGAVVAGVALIALGSLLKSFSGGGGSASTSGGGGGGATGGAGFAGETGTIDEGFATTDAVSQEPQTIVNVNVEGNSFGNEEFTRQIVESIGEEGGKQGLVFDNFQTA